MTIKLKKIIEDILPEYVRPIIRVKGENYYILKRETVGDYYVSGNIHSPKTTMNRDEATKLSGDEAKNLEYENETTWYLIDVSNEDGEEVNELHFTGQTLDTVGNDLVDFLGKEHKKLGYTNPLDTFHLIQQVLDSGKIISKVKGIR